METDLTELINIGPVTAEKLIILGIKSKEDFLKHDPYEVFHQLITNVDCTLCKSALAGIVGAKENLPWHKVSKMVWQNYHDKYPEDKVGR